MQFAAGAAYEERPVYPWSGRPREYVAEELHLALSPEALVIELRGSLSGDPEGPKEPSVGAIALGPEVFGVLLVDPAFGNSPPRWEWDRVLERPVRVSQGHFWHDIPFPHVGGILDLSQYRTLDGISASLSLGRALITVWVEVASRAEKQIPIVPRQRPGDEAVFDTSSHHKDFAYARWRYTVIPPRQLLYRISRPSYSYYVQVLLSLLKRTMTGEALQSKTHLPVPRGILAIMQGSLSKGGSFGDKSATIRRHGSGPIRYTWPQHLVTRLGQEQLVKKLDVPGRSFAEQEHEISDSPIASEATYVFELDQSTGKDWSVSQDASSSPEPRGDVCFPPCVYVADAAGEALRQCWKRLRQTGLPDWVYPGLRKFLQRVRSVTVIGTSEARVAFSGDIDYLFTIPSLTAVGCDLGVFRPCAPPQQSATGLERSLQKDELQWLAGTWAAGLDGTTQSISWPEPQHVSAFKLALLPCSVPCWGLPLNNGLRIIWYNLCSPEGARLAVEHGRMKTIIDRSGADGDGHALTRRADVLETLEKLEAISFQASLLSGCSIQYAVGHLLRALRRDLQRVRGSY